MSSKQEQQHTRTAEPMCQWRPLTVAINRHEYQGTSVNQPHQQGTSASQPQHQQQGTSFYKAQKDQYKVFPAVLRQEGISRYPVTGCGSPEEGQKDVVSPAPLSASLICKELQDIAFKCQTMASQIDSINVSPFVSEAAAVGESAAFSGHASLIEKNLMLTMEISELKACRDEWKRRCSYLEGKLSHSRQGEDKGRILLTHALEACPQQGQDKAGINAVVKESRRQIESLEAKLTMRDLETGSLRTQLDDLNVMVTHMSAQLVTYKEDFETERKDRERAQGRIAELETQLLVSESQSYTGELSDRTNNTHHHPQRQHLLTRGSYDMCDDVQPDSDDTHIPSFITDASPLNACNQEPRDCSRGPKDAGTTVTKHCIQESEDGGREPKDVTREPKNDTRELNANSKEPKDPTRVSRECNRETKECRRDLVNVHSKSYKGQLISNGIEKTCSALPNNDARYSLKDIDETDHKSTDRRKAGQITRDKSQIKLASSSGDKYLATDVSNCLVDKKVVDTMGGAVNETDGSTPSPVETNCKWYLGTPRGEINKISFVDGKGLILLKSGMAPVQEGSVTSGECESLKKQFSDINCYQSARPERRSSSPAMPLSKYVKTSGTCSSAAARTRLMGSSMDDHITLTPRCVGDTDQSSISLFYASTGECVVKCTPGTKESVSTMELEVDSAEDSEEPLQCPKCRKHFRIEDHYLLMEHMEEVCLQC